MAWPSWSPSQMPPSPYQPSPGTKRKRTDSDTVNGAVGGGQRLYRSASNQSSTSSDILVAPGPVPVSRDPSMAARRIEGTSEKRISARSYEGTIHFTGVPRDFLRRLAESNNDVKQIFDALDDSVKVEVTNSADVELDDSQRNARGTFSKEYKDKFPQIRWVHRGQGRYLPPWEAKEKTSAAYPTVNSELLNGLARRTSGRNVVAPLEQLSSSPASLIKRQSSTSTIMKVSNDEVITPTLKRRATAGDVNSAGSYSLRQRPSDFESPSAAESRALRLSRRARAMQGSMNEDAATDEEDEENDLNDDDDEEKDETDDDDPDKTYRREDIDRLEARGDNGPWYHTGNGWYKRGNRPMLRKESSSQHSMSQRRESDATLRRTSSRTIQRRESYMTADVNAGDEDESEQTMRKEELLAKFPGHEYHHCGNGWFKLGPAGNKKRPSHVAPTTDQYGAGEVESEDGFDAKGTVSKEYKEAHPEIAWIHRGNGRYKRVATVQKEVKDVLEEEQLATPSLQHQGSEEDSKKSYPTDLIERVGKHYFEHAGFGRWRPKPGYSMATILAQTGNRDLATSLEASAGRAQVRRLAAVKRQNSFAINDNSDSEDNEDGLVDRAYVDAHPEKNFHHRGQGRWARGLPPEGTSRKVAVRGPRAAEYLAMNRQRSPDVGAEEEEEIVDGKKPPHPTALVMREEKDAWPNFRWYYRGGARWSRTSKSDENSGPRWREKHGILPYKDNSDPAGQFGSKITTEDGEDDPYVDDRGYLLPEPRIVTKGPGKLKRKRNSGKTLVPLYGSNQASTSGTSTPRPRMLEPEEDILTEEDLPDLYRDRWPTPDRDEPDDEATKILRKSYLALVGYEAFVKSLTKHDPVVRPTANLIALAENAQYALEKLQDEYLRLERVTAPHARIPRKPAKGGRKPLDPEEFEDRKEADLYDYTFDAKRIGFQDPIGQRIQRDAEGRELRVRRKRGEVDIITAEVGLGDPGEGPSRRRAVRPVQRFDGVDLATTRRRRAPNNKAGSATPDPAASPGTLTPAPGAAGEVLPNGYIVPTTGRWAGHIPKRIRELRGESVPSAKGDSEKGGSPGPPGSRKGRPPGSKNLRKRRDAGIPKGPRKKKEVVADSVEEFERSESAEREDVEYRDSLDKSMWQHW